MTPERANFTVGSSAWTTVTGKNKLFGHSRPTYPEKNTPHATRDVHIELLYRWLSPKSKPKTAASREGRIKRSALHQSKVFVFSR
jgi:hypothetical protein